MLAKFLMHEAEGDPYAQVESMQQLERRGELERLEFAGLAEGPWAPVSIPLTKLSSALLMVRPVEWSL